MKLRKFKNLLPLVFLFAISSQLRALTKITGNFTPCGGTTSSYSLDLSTAPACGGTAYNCIDPNTGQTKTPFRRYKWHVRGGIIQGADDKSFVYVKWNDCPPDLDTSQVYNIYCTIECIGWDRKILSSEPLVYNCIEQQINTNYSEQRSIHISCPTLKSIPSISGNCCGTTYTTLNFETVFATESVSIQDQDVEIINIGQPVESPWSNSKRYPFTLSIPIGKQFITIVVTNKCGVTKTYNIPINYIGNTLMAGSFPNTICSGQSFNFCALFERGDCMDFQWFVEKLDPSGVVYLSNTINESMTLVSPTNAYCKAFTFNALNCGEKTRITFRHKTKCETTWQTLTWTINTPLPSLNVVTLSSAAILNSICPCKTNMQLLLPNTDGCAETVEWEYGNNTNTETVELPASTAFQPTFCHSWMFGTGSQISGPFTDIKIRYRRKNSCGSSAWSEITIPASYFKPYTDNACQ